MMQLCVTSKKACHWLFLPVKNMAPDRSRDWAAKAPWLLGIRAVIAESFERIHRSNLVGMGVMPLVFEPGTSWQSLGIEGDELVTLRGLSGALQPRQKLILKIKSPGGLQRGDFAP